MNLSRRRFWSYAAPAIVLAPNIMRVSAAALESLPNIIEGIHSNGSTWYRGYDTLDFSELVTTTLRAHPAEIWESVRGINRLLIAMQDRETLKSLTS